MYKLLNLYGVNLHSAYRTQGVQETMKKCLFCNFYHRNITRQSVDHLQLRYHSSTINTLILSSVGKKRFRRRSKKYAELLEVTDSSTSNRKAAVQNLNAAQLSVLVNQPDITLDKLHKIKNKYSTKQSNNDKNFYSNTVNVKDSMENANPSVGFSEFPDTLNADIIKQLTIIDNLAFDVQKDERELLVEELETSGITDETTLIKSSNLAHSLANTNEEESFNDKEVEFNKSKHKKKIIEKSVELEESEETIIDTERKSKEVTINEEKLKQFNNSLLSYMKVCLNNNSITLGNRLLYTFRKAKVKTSYLYINDIAVFNSYIEKLASNSDLKSILEILQEIREYEITLNAQTYAYVFDCIGRMKNDKQYKLNILKQIEIEMYNDGINLNDVITKSNFVNDQRTFVLNTIKLLDNQFKPIYEEPDIAYSCRLLEKLLDDSATPCSTVEGLLKVSDFEDRLKKQIDLEVNGQLTVQNIAKRKTLNKNIIFYRNKLDNLEKKWQKVALQAFKRNLIALKNYESHSHRTKLNLYPYLEALNPEDYVRILITEARQLAMGSEMYSLPYNVLCREMGNRVYKMYEIQVNQNNGVNKKTSEVYLQYCDWFVNRNDKLNSRKKWTLLEHEANKEGVTLGVQLPSWQKNIHASIGSFLFSIILNDLKFEANLLSHKNKSHHGCEHQHLAFFKIFRHSGVMLKEEVKPHPLLVKIYKDSEPETLTFDTTLVPSFCPPRPWISIKNGGYIVTKTDIVRLSHSENQQWNRLVKSPPNKLYPALDSLNQLGTIPWTINCNVLDVAIKVFQNDGSLELNMPQPPSILANIPPAQKNSSLDVRKKVHKARIELKRKKNEMYSLWCDALYRLSLANHFRNEIFWLPHNMDFRGRVYPVPPHLNHLGSDLARSILIFALKKPLGPNGFKWLKLHLINLTGFKKREPISERLKYADEIMDKILDSAENPLTGEMWWSKSDEPWQTLAACMEIAAALKSPNLEEFKSGFPIHQDGSCNGLQHYAALGRDQIGAVSVNLYPSESPQDVYSSVASMVDERRKEDAKNGNHIAQILEGFIKRKVIKQTVMTTVYGVTWFGAKLQIARQLKDIDEFPQEFLWPSSTYLVNKTFQTLRTMFKSAREIQDWFTECSRLICISRGENMEWVTPLGLPVVQPYSKIHHPNLKKKGTTVCFTPDILGKPHVMKQKNAFPPNFVHSLDSSHMMLTSINSEHVGITFVSVHDCYWTHPCTVEIMNKLCREQFVALHSEPILDDLSSFLIEKFGYKELNNNVQKNISKEYLLQKKLNATLINVPKQGDFDLNKVLSSTYFFS